MASELTFGSVPPFYRELYDILCPDQDTQIDRDIFLKLLDKSSLPALTLNTIWEIVENKQGYLTRVGLYKTLALTALAQQGKPVNEKILESFGGQELPKPALGDLSDLKYLSNRLRREKNPSKLCYTFQELCNMDVIKVDIIPEKKGLFLKHVEYQVTSERYRTTVRRRYNDFVALHELLLLRFPYRMLPRLPPKKMMGGDAVFIEERKRALRRFLTLICRHPIVAEDKIVHFFLTFTGQEMQNKIREVFRNVPDECVTSNLAVKAKELVPLDTQMQFTNSREQLKQMHASINHLKEIVDRIIARSQAHSLDMQEFGKELCVLSAERTELVWASGGSETWINLKKVLKNLSGFFTQLSHRMMEQANDEEDSISENINLLLDLLAAYKDLCDRHERGIQQDHQRAISKMTTIKKKMAQVSGKGADNFTTDQLESRILEQESHILNMEIRSYYALYCIHLETQLVHLNMAMLYEVLQSLISVEAVGHREISKIWENFQPFLEMLLPNSSKSPINSRPTSPVN